MAENRNTPQSLHRRSPRHRTLRREIAWVLTFKIVALAALYFAFFGPPHRVHVTPAQVAAVLGGAVQTQATH